MNDSSENVDRLFMDWRKQALSSSYEAILDDAYQFSMSRGTADSQNRNGDLIDALFQQARSNNLEPVFDALIGEDDIKKNITKNAMAERITFHKESSDKHAYFSNMSARILKNISGTKEWLSELTRPLAYAVASISVVALVGITYLKTADYQSLNQASIVYMDIPVGHDIEAGMFNDVEALGFSKESSLEVNQFHLGRAFSKLSYVNTQEDGIIQDKESLQRIFIPYMAAFIALDRQALPELIENISKTPEQLKQITEPYLDELAIYAGYWVQNLFFASEVESDRDIRLLMNHERLLPVLEVLLSSEQYARAHNTIKSYRDDSSSVSRIDMQMLGNMLLIWLG